LSQSEVEWWNFLNEWADSLQSQQPLEIDELCEKYNLDSNQAREFVDYFEEDHIALKPNDLEVCMGATCRAKGSERIWDQLNKANNGRVPESQIIIRPSLCLSECDRAPCAKEGTKIRTSEDQNWLNRILRV
tara:strand:- start:67071 stop:67466 length:396 start_codon:yes stop_codon:yes gene_type:complete